jgi:general secretion pathway protein N
MRQSVHWGVVALLLSSPVAAGVAAGPADQSSAALNNPLAARPLDLLSDTRDRPLFSPHRRPPPPPAPPPVRVVAPAPPAPPPSIGLMAILTDDGVPLAVVRTSEKAIHARVGDEIAGWKVTQIEPRRLVLASDDREVSFDMFAREVPPPSRGLRRLAEDPGYADPSVDPGSNRQKPSTFGGAMSVSAPCGYCPQRFFAPSVAGPPVENAARPVVPARRNSQRR